MAIPLLHLSSPFLLSSLTQKRFIYHHHHNYKNTLPKIPSSSFRNGSSNTPPETECPVPLDQQPINEYQNLSTSFPFSWASGDIVEYCSRLFVTGASFALLIALPVAWFGTVAPKTEPLKPVLAALSSGVFVVSLAVVRMYLGWAYVGNRLLSATVECNSSLSSVFSCFIRLLRNLKKNLRDSHNFEFWVNVFVFLFWERRVDVKLVKVTILGISCCCFWYIWLMGWFLISIFCRWRDRVVWWSGTWFCFCYKSLSERLYGTVSLWREFEKFIEIKKKDT